MSRPRTTARRWMTGILTQPWSQCFVCDQRVSHMGPFWPFIVPSGHRMQMNLHQKHQPLSLHLSPLPPPTPSASHHNHNNQLSQSHGAGSTAQSHCSKTDKTHTKCHYLDYIHSSVLYEIFITAQWVSTSHTPSFCFL